MKPAKLGLCLIAFPFMLVQPSAASEENDLRKAQNFIILPEVAMASFAAISGRSDNKLNSLGWTAQVSDRLWSINIENYGTAEKVRLVINGYSWGSDYSSNIISYTGTGIIGNEPLLIHGRIGWPESKAKGDLTQMTFEQTTKIGQNSLWTWVVGTEIVGCGLAGGISANVLAGGLSSGLSIPFAASIFVTGASSGAKACTSISSVVKESLETDTPPAPPKAPEAPIIGPKEPLSSNIIVVASSNGELSGRFPLGLDRRYISLDGMMFWRDGYAKGVVYNQELK